MHCKLPMIVLLLAGVAQSVALTSEVVAAPAAATTATPRAALPRNSVYQLHTPLTDQSGRAITWADKRGQAQVVVMFYTSCKFICPTIIDTMLDLDRRLTPSERAKLGVLMITLDPQRDDANALMDTAHKRQLDLTRWTLAQPRTTDLRAIASVLGVRYRPLDDGEINHTGVLVLLDAEGRVAARSNSTVGAIESTFLSQVRKVLATP